MPFAPAPAIDRPTARPSWRLWLAALALFVQVLLPVQLLRAAGIAGETIVLCTMGGSVTLDAAALDGMAPADAGHKAGMVCPLCAGGAGAPLAPVDPAAALAAPVEFAGVDFARADAPAMHSGGLAAYGSRAPPVLL